MSVGSVFRNRITTFIDKYGSTAVIIPQTIGEGTRGGYEGKSETAGTSVSTKAIPSKYIFSKGGETIGRLEEGTLDLTFCYDETINKDSDITWQGDTYDIIEIHNRYLQDVKVAIQVTIKRKL